MGNYMGEKGYPKALQVGLKRSGERRPMVRRMMIGRN